MDQVSPVDTYLGQLAPGSRRAQRQVLDRVARYLSRRRLGVDGYPWHELTYEDAVRARVWAVKTFAPATARRMMAGLHRIAEECWRLGLMESEQLARVRSTEPVRGGSLPPGRALSVVELSLLFRECQQDPDRATGARDAAAIALMAGAGLRRREVVDLRLVDVSHEDKTIEVAGKGAKRRRVPMAPELQPLLVAWEVERGRSPGPYICHARVSGEQTPLTDSAIYRIVESRRQRAGIDHCSPHDLRRTFVTSLLRSGAALEKVSTLAGHEDVKTTALYDYAEWDQHVETVRHVRLGGLTTGILGANTDGGRESCL